MKIKFHIAAAGLLPSCSRQAATAITKLPATAELPLPPLCFRCCRCGAAVLPKALTPPPKLRFCQATTSTAKLAAAATLPLLPPPPQLPRCHHRGALHATVQLLPLLPSRCRHRLQRRPAAASVATTALPLSPLLTCHHAAHHRCTSAAAGPLPLPTPRCRQCHHPLHFHCHYSCCHHCRFRHRCRRCF